MQQQVTPRMRYLGEIGDGWWLVESTSQPGRGHKVDTLRDRCGCRAGQFGKRCHHRVWAEQAEAWRVRTAQTSTSVQAPAVARPAGMAALLEAFA